MCSEKGHISRDCPKNEKGLYYKGGGCYICGDVRHIQKHCPKNPENSIRNNKLSMKDDIEIKKGEIEELEPVF